MQRLLLLLSSLFLFLVSSAYQFEVDGIYYKFDLTPNTVEVTYKNWDDAGYSGSLVIPETVSFSGKTYSVRSIGQRAFSGCSGLISVKIPNSVTSIGDYAFAKCGELTSISIPESVTSIGSYVFSGCSVLTSITIPESVTSIGDYAFQYCSGLTSITIPDSVTKLGGSAFNGCTSLTSITIPESVTSIGSHTFYRCTSLTSITIPSSVTSIGNGAFADCDGLTEVTCYVKDPSKIKMGSYVFHDMSTSTLYVPCGNKALYEAAAQWKNFGNIVEIVEPYGISIEDMEISPRMATLVPVYLINEGNVTSLQFDIHLPDGLALAKDENGDGRVSAVDVSMVVEYVLSGRPVNSPNQLSTSHQQQESDYQITDED